MNNNNPEMKSDEDIILDCKKAMHDWYSWFTDNVTAYKADMKFYGGDQWDDETYREYVQKKIPTLVLDQVGPNIRKMMGQQKNADVTANLVSRTTDMPQANYDLISGLVKRILYNAHSRDVFSQCYESQLAGGWGVIKLGTDYESPTTFDQKITLDVTYEPVNVFFDPIAEGATKEDGQWCGSYEMMSKDEFKEKYPNATVPTTPLLPESAPQWPLGLGDVAVIAEYYTRHWEPKTLIQLSNGQDWKRECFVEEKEACELEYLLEKESQGLSTLDILPLEETNRRRTEICKIMCYKLTSQEVLECYEWMASDLPYLYVDGNSFWSEGKQYTRSFVSYAKDAQRLYNYAMSQVAFGLKASRRERFWMTAKQAEGYTEILRKPDQVQGALPYNVDPAAPNPPPPIAPQEVASSFFNAAEVASADVNKTLGMIDPMSGGIMNGASGAAIGRTLYEQNLNVVNYEQNLYGAIERVGRQLLELIPKIYDTQRVVTIDLQGEAKQVMINDFDADGNPVNHIGDMMADIGDIEVSANMSDSAVDELQTRFLLQLAADPEVKPYVMDLIPKSLNLPVAPELEQRLKYLVPPYVQKNMPPPPPPPPGANPEVAIKQAEIQSKMIDSQNKLQASREKAAVDMAKLGLERESLAVEIDKAQLQSATELTTAHIDARASMTQALADLAKHRADVSKNN